MKIHVRMPQKLKPYFEEELNLASQDFLIKNYLASWVHLERAHILGQAYPWQHTLVHWRMLVFGIKTKNTKEIIGQIPRLFIGGIKSFVGEIPVGNTGGANVPALKSMTISKDMQEILNIAKK